VITFCAVGSGHDQYFFRHPELMVSGRVEPPRLDLTAEDLIRDHVHAIWLGHAHVPLKVHSARDLIDIEDPDLPLKPEVREAVQLSEEELERVRAECLEVLRTCDGLAEAGWYSEEWLDRVLREAPRRFDEAWNRWRELYRDAQRRYDEASRRLRARPKDSAEREALERQRDEAEHQMDLLLGQTERAEENDFYPYRYLATEGLLPGYNFPKLPLRAYLPMPRENRGEFISRPRFLAVTEFGPRNVVYHEGYKFRVVAALSPPERLRQLLSTARACRACGYLHVGDDLLLDRCTGCRADLAEDRSGQLLTDLFEMGHVRTTRSDRIYCDEEERLRYGYQVELFYRFMPGRARTARVYNASGPLLNLVHGSTAELWLVNQGWRRSSTPGFGLSLEDGYWIRRAEEREVDQDEQGEGRMVRVVRPYVRDTRNVLVVQLDPAWRPTDEREAESLLASLQYALQHAAARVFQVEDREIAAARVGRGHRQAVLLWEAAEGGLGVLRLVVEEPRWLPEIAKVALDICHFGPNGEDLAAGRCERACYDCLLGYDNQPDHLRLDRHRVLPLLLELTGARVEAGPRRRPRAEQYAWLLGQIDPKSELERETLDVLWNEGYRLPDHAQRRPEPDVDCTPDFWYEPRLCLFCDGPHHDQPDVARRDRLLRAQLEARGYIVEVIRHDRPVAEQVRELASKYPDYFREDRS
jgi:hypothetical protein